MKICRYILVLGLLSLLGKGSGAWAQTNLPSTQPVDSTKNTVEGRVVTPVKSTDLDPTAVGTDLVRPVRPERQELSPAVKAGLDRFDKYLRAYLEQEEALRKKLLAATDEERAKVREKMEELRKRWWEKTIERREQMEERVRELRPKLTEDYNEVLRSTLKDARQNALDNAKEQARDQIKELRDQLNQEGRER